jgi:hypothetical protein
MSYPPYPGPSEHPGEYPSYPTTPQPAIGYPPPAGYYIKEPEPARGLMSASIVFAVLLTCFEIIEAALAWAAQSDYLDAADEGLTGLDVSTPYDFAALPYLALLIAVYVVTCLWLHKVRTNAELIFPGAHHARSKGWVWGSWICPVVSLWFPFQIVRDVARDPREFKSNALIGWWWAFWLTSLIVGQISSRLVGFGEINRDLVSALGTAETINAVLATVACALWVTIVRRIGRDQDRLLHITR